MSVPSKITLGLAIGISSAIIGYVHYKQSDDRLKLHEGVLRDIAQQQRRKHENTYQLQQQIEISKQLKQMVKADPNTQPVGHPDPKPAFIRVEEHPINSQTAGNRSTQNEQSAALNSAASSEQKGSENFSL